MNSLKIDVITSLLSDFEPPVTEPNGNTRRAAVAAILRKQESHIEALFILRAEKQGDPWSGQMAFPGGHLEPSDESLRHAAERETFEEIGLDLDQHAKYLGPIVEVRANPRGKNLDMIVSPFVYLLTNNNPPLNLNYEVADVLWGSLDDMYNGNNIAELEFDLQGSSQMFSGYQVGGEIVWGLTRLMLHHLFLMLNPDWKP